MKKWILLLALFCCYKLNAQSYIPMPLEDGMLWRTFTVQSTMEHYDDDKVYGDTIAWGHSYKVIHRSSYSSPFSPFPWPFGSNAVFYIREDTSAKKVFTYMMNQDMLQYDFSLQVGDTIHSIQLNALKSGGVDTVRVELIDSILLNGVFHKRFVSTSILPALSTPYTYQYIEGIGGVSGFLEYSNGFESGSGLVCVGKIFNQSLYPDSTYNCIFATSLNDIQSENQLHIYPNPSSDFIQIHSTVSMMKIELMDIFGHVFYSKSTNSKDTVFSISHLPNGVYSARILRSDGQVLVRKFLKE